MPTSVKSVEALQDEVVKLDKYKTTGYVESHGLLKEFHLTSDKQGQFIHIYALKGIGIMRYDHYRADTIVAAFDQMSQIFAEATVYLQTIVVEQPQDPSRELIELTHAAWAARFAAAPLIGGADVSVSKARRDVAEASLKGLKDNLCSCLTAGREGVARWNLMLLEDIRKVNWSNSKLSSLVLNGANLARLNLEGSNFDHSKMENASCCFACVSGASFRGASLNDADLTSLKAEGADFSDAHLVKANLENAKLKNCKLLNADLTGANLRRADLRGVDLKTAKLVNAQFDGATYDEATSLPDPFPAWSKLTWRGEKDSDPYKQMMKDKILTTTVGDFDEFMMHLQQQCDQSRLDKVFQMLKKERFKLFSEVSDKNVLGIVKSQTDPDLVYACRLADNGSFTCCTQNLKACGGLRGALCKHLLVLIIGLAKAKQVDLSAVVRWILASTLEKPVIDKLMLTEVFLRYKGSEAGELDWRPTETIPEDYYAF